MVIVVASCLQPFGYEGEREPRRRTVPGRYVHGLPSKSHTEEEAAYNAAGFENESSLRPASHRKLSDLSAREGTDLLRPTAPRASRARCDFFLRHISEGRDAVCRRSGPSRCIRTLQWPRKTLNNLRGREVDHCPHRGTWGDRRTGRNAFGYNL